MTALEEARRLAGAGQLDPRLSAALRGHNRRWRRDETQWWKTHDAYRAWCDAHGGAAPDTFDDGAAGLRPWLLAQNDQELSARQRTALHTLPGWRGTIGNPDAAHTWGIACALHTAGINPARRDDTTSIREQAAAARDAYTGNQVFETAAVTVVDAADDPEMGKVLTYALFRARNLREPIAVEPSGNWVRMARASGGTSGVRRVIALLDGEAR